MALKATTEQMVQRFLIYVPYVPFISCSQVSCPESTPVAFKKHTETQHEKDCWAQIF